MTEEINQAEEAKVEESVEQAEAAPQVETATTPEVTQGNAPVAISADVKNWCMFCHASAFCGLLSIPPVIGPLVIWLIKKDEMPEVDKHGKEAVNFQLSFLIYFIVSGMLFAVIIGFLILPVVLILWLIFTIMASVKASNGEFYRYPMTIRFIK